MPNHTAGESLLPTPEICDDPGPQGSPITIYGPAIPGAKCKSPPFTNKAQSACTRHRSS